MRQQARIALADMEDDRPRLEQGEIAFLIGRNLAERMKRQMREFLHRPKRNEAHLIGLAHFLKRPANRVSRASPLPPSGDCLKAVMVAFMVTSPWMSFR